MKWVHASPLCRSHSQVDRGKSRRRDQHGRPLTRLAKADDKATRHVDQLIEQIKEHAPAAMYTIENPESKTFKMVPCIAKLRRTEGWRWLRCIDCKCASQRLDQGKWPHKHTDILVWGVLHDFELPVCRDDCDHLVPCIGPQGRRRHWVVLCTSDRNSPEQFVITNHMIKRRLPHGLIHRLARAHKRWLENKGAVPNEPCTFVRMTKDTARQAVERAVSAFVMCMKDVGERAHAARADDTMTTAAGRTMRARTLPMIMDWGIGEQC